MDISICLNRLGVKPENLTLSQAVPPHTITRWEGGDPQPTEAELQAAWDASFAPSVLYPSELRNLLRSVLNSLYVLF